MTPLETAKAMRAYLILRNNLPTLNETVEDVMAVFSKSKPFSTYVVRKLLRLRVIGVSPHIDFGITDLWALKQKTDCPLVNLCLGDNSIVYTNKNSYTFELPYNE